MTPIDLLICPRWLIPVEPAGVTLTDHAVAVQGDEIVAVLPRADAEAQFVARERVELPDHVLLPGLVNTHTHAAMSLMRGLADDLPLMRWLESAIWPAERRFVAPDFVRTGTELAACEMLLGGVTCANEMYFFPDAAAEAFDACGMRALVGMTIIDFPSAYASDADDYLHKGLMARDRWRGHPLVEFAFAPHAPYTVSDGTLSRVVQLANELGAPVHMHIHETAQEIADSLTRHGCRPIERLARLGMLETELIAVHAAHVLPGEIDLMARHGVSVAHCPTSNLKLASGIAPVADMLDRGVTVGIGTDGAASNNRLDLLAEARLAGLLAKGSSGNASAMPAHAQIHAMTLGGAQVLRMGERIGSIVSGKQADLVAINLGELFCQPCFDPASHVANVAGRQQVTDVWVAGTARVRAQRLLWDHNNELLRKVRVWQNRLKSEAIGQ